MPLVKVSIPSFSSLPLWQNAQKRSLRREQVSLGNSLSCCRLWSLGCVVHRPHDREDIGEGGLFTHGGKPKGREIRVLVPTWKTSFHGPNFPPRGPLLAGDRVLSTWPLGSNYNPNCSTLLKLPFWLPPLPLMLLTRQCSSSFIVHSIGPFSYESTCVAIFATLERTNCSAFCHSDKIFELNQLLKGGEHCFLRLQSMVTWSPWHWGWSRPITSRGDDTEKDAYWPVFEPGTHYWPASPTEPHCL